MLSPQLLALVHHTVPFTKMIDCCAWLWAPLQTLIGHYPGTSFYMGGTIKYRCCRTTLDFFFLTPFCRDKVSRSCYTGHAGLKPWSVTCVEAVWKFASYIATLPRNVGLARFLNGTSRITTETRKTCLHLGDSTHTHNSRPSQSYGPRGKWENYYNQTSAFQAPLYKSLLMRAPCLRFGRLKPR